MKKLLIVFSMLLLSLASMAQDVKQVKELGVVFANDDAFGLTFRFGNEYALWRINAMSLFGRVSNTQYVSHDTNNNIGDYRVSIGRENRISIGQHANFRFGADASFSYSRHDIDFHSNSYIISNSASGSVNSYEPGLNLVLGLSYKIKQIVLGAELQPSISYQIINLESKSSDGDLYEGKMTNWSYGLSQSPLLFTAVYQF